MLIIKINNRLTKPQSTASKFAKLGVFAFGLIYSALAIFANTQHSSALTYEGGAGVGFKVKDTINVSLSGELVIPDLAINTSDDSDAVDVRVSTNTSNGYTLSAQMATASADLTASGVSAKFTGLASDASVDTLTAGTWGYKTSADSGTTWSNYSGLPVSGGSAKTLVDKDAQPSGGSEVATQIKIGAYALSDMPSSIYTNTIVFSAVTKEAPTPSVPYMQDVATWGSSLTTNVAVQAVDQRDNKTYWVTKLADGNIWMTQNLDYDISSSTNTISNLDGTTGTWTSSSTYPPQATSTTLSSSSISTGTYSWDPGDYYVENGGGDTACTTWRPASDCGSTKSANSLTSSSAIGDTTLHYHLGNYYQYNAATAGTGGTASQDATSSICPAGWRLPTTNSYTNNYSFGKLTNAYGITSSSSGSSDAALLASPLWFVRGGGVYDGSLLNQGTYGSVWSSMPDYYDTYFAYCLFFYSSYVNPSGSDIRYYGYSARCVAE